MSQYSLLPAFKTCFTQGGICAFSIEPYEGKVSEQESNLISIREGFYGWMGFGGSVLQVKCIN